MCALLCAGSATVNVLLLDFLRRQIAGKGNSPVPEWMVTHLMGVAGLFMVFLVASAMMAIIFTDAVAPIRTALLHGLLATRCPVVEKTGQAALPGVVPGDAENQANDLSDAPQFLMHFVTGMVCFSYLAWLSPFAFACFLGTVVLGLMLTTDILHLCARKHEECRVLKDRDHKHLHALFDAAKELATHLSRRRYFTNRELLPSVNLLKRTQMRYDLYRHLGEVWTSVGHSLFREWRWLKSSAHLRMSSVRPSVTLSPSLLWPGRPASLSGWCPPFHGQRWRHA